jgi:EAL domain-containing protein (putative c-di-GMP-specific phosphodiesterase class I)
MKHVDEPLMDVQSAATSIWFLSGQMSEDEPVRHIVIRSSPFTVGRRSDSSMRLAQNCISKRHAKIVQQGNDLWLHDEQSTNGTYVNGEPVTEPVKLQPGDLVQFAAVVFRLGRAEQLGENLTDAGTIHEDTCDQALAMVQLERLISERAVVPYFQPILRIDDASWPLVGYEVLGRSRLTGLGNASQMFKTASQLNLEAELSRVFRSQGVELAQPLNHQISLFLNTHPAELLREGLLASLQELRQQAAGRPLVLEIHEAAMTNPEMIRSLRDNLNALEIQLAFDDFGAGQARLLELADVRPDYIKFDMKLIQGIHLAAASRQQVVALLVRMVNDLDIVPVAEGVENAEDHEVLRQMGVRMGQGYYYGRPESITRHSRNHADSGPQT